MIMSSELTEASIGEMTRAWYAALDRHDDLESVLGFLVDDDLEMRFPEGTSRGHAGFTEWYNTVTARFFDEVHTVQDVTVVTQSPAEAQIKVLVNWQAKIHDGREAKSAWLGFDAYQTWTVVPGPDGPRIKVYTVDKLDPMQGSAAL
jgi:ketosteroid isomerase-like protein